MAPNSIFRQRRRRRRSHLDRQRRGVALLAFLESGESLRMNARGGRGVAWRGVGLCSHVANVPMGWWPLQNPYPNTALVVHL